MMKARSFVTSTVLSKARKGDSMNVQVAIVLGSYSDGDIGAFFGAMRIISADERCSNLQIAGHVISCHRNPEELRQFVEQGCEGAKVVIAMGGKALALPGVIDALLYESGQAIPVIGVALGEPGSEALRAAQLSIEQLPGAPVILDVTGRCYSGAEGLVAALVRIATEGVPPTVTREGKRALLNFFRNWAA